MSADPQTPAEAKTALVESIGAVSQLVVRGLGAQLDPPCVVVGIPRLEWGGYRPADAEIAEPSSVTFPVFLVVPLNPDTTVDLLLRYGPLVHDAIERATGAAIDAADPGTYAAPNGDLPAYLFDAEFPLS